MTSYDAALPDDPDAASCLCVVASFVNSAPTLEQVTKEAARRVLMSPVVSDLVEFRFADLGSHPGQHGDYAPAIRALTNALLAPRTPGGRNYFAVFMVDRSAVIAAHVLSLSARAPLISELRPRLSGLANTDDRPEASRSAGPRIVTSPTGVWRDTADMVTALYRFADGLQRSLAASREPGLPPARLDALRNRHHQQSIVPPTPAAVPVLTFAPGPVSTPPPGPEPVAPPAPGPAPLPPAAPVLTPGPVPEPAGELAANAAPLRAQAAGPDTGSPSERRSLAGRARRFLPSLRGPRGDQPTDRTVDAEPGPPRAERLVYLLVVGNGSGEEGPLNRARSALLEVDEGLAKLPGFSFRVRLLHGDEDSLSGGTRDAGELGRRDTKKIVGGSDFASVLEHIRASLRRDPERRDISAPPTVVLFTSEPPLAEARAAEQFRALAAEATVIWARPRSAQHLISESFTRAPGVHVITDDQGVADEVATLFRQASLTFRPSTASADS